MNIFLILVSINLCQKNKMKPNKYYPKITVIMSAYNSSRTIHVAVKSILNQDYKNLELFVIDDASSDNTLEILSNLENQNKNMKVFLNESNIGLTKSLNKLLKKVDSDYIARQDADDISVHNRISEQYKYLEKHPSKIGCSTLAKDLYSKKFINLKSSYLPLSIVLKYKNPFVHGSFLFRKSIFSEIGLYDESYYYAQDYKFISEVYLKGFSLGIVKKNLYLLNTINNISNIYKEEQNYYSNLVSENYKENR